MKNDHRSKFSNLSNWKGEAWKREHRTGIAEVTGSNPVEALIFFRLLPSNCLNWKIYCDDHSSLRLIIIVISFIQLVEYSVSTGFVASRLIGWIELLQISWFSIKNDRSRLIRCLSGHGSHSSYQLIDRIADQYLSTSAGRVLFIQMPI